MNFIIGGNLSKSRGLNYTPCVLSLRNEQNKTQKDAYSRGPQSVVLGPWTSISITGNLLET